MPRVGRHVRLAGRVQGVFFRAWTREQAEELGVGGWVRNCPDGSVEAQLHGEEEDVGRLIERLRQGPPAALVTEVQVDAIDTVDDGRFDVRH